MTEDKIRLLVVDDHAMVREGLHMVLAAQPDMEVVGEAANGQEALEMVRLHDPDIVLMDITMPGMSGIEATKGIAGTGLKAKVLGLTVHENLEYFFHMLAAGASGYILKRATSLELLSAIRSIHQGGVYLSATMAAHMAAEYISHQGRAIRAGDDGLTAREVEVLHLIAQGLTNQDAAKALHLSVYTVQTHRANFMRKLGLENRQQLMRYAVRKGYLDQER